MKRIINIFCAATVLLLGLWGCKQDQPEQLDSVDLRYKVQGSLDLTYHAQPFQLVVTSTKPWSVRSLHPDWCIISDEEGEASDAELVRVGKGEKHVVTVQYYDNLDMDEREDYIEISSNGWVVKKLTIVQSGIAYLTIPTEESKRKEIIDGAGEEIQLHVSANQVWTAKVVTGRDWLTITDGASGDGDGVITLTAANNPEARRYASVGVYDRHNKRVYNIQYTQDGVQLDPAFEEVLVNYDRKTASLDVESNANWIAYKENEADDWYEIVNPENVGSGKLNFTFTPNNTPDLRTSTIIMVNVPDPEEEDPYILKRRITVKQGYIVEPEWVPADKDMLEWSTDGWTKPTLVSKGLKFSNKSRIHKSPMPFGSYTFCWTDISSDAKVRHWFCYGSDKEEQEMKFNLEGGVAKLDFSKGQSTAPTGYKSYSGVDMSKPHTFTYKFEPYGTSWCEITFLLDDIVIYSFLTNNSAEKSVMSKITWGSNANIYFGAETGSAICEGYWYTAPVEW